MSEDEVGNLYSARIFTHPTGGYVVLYRGVNVHTVYLPRSTRKQLVEAATREVAERNRADIQAYRDNHGG